MMAQIWLLFDKMLKCFLEDLKISRPLVPSCGTNIDWDWLLSVDTIHSYWEIRNKSKSVRRMNVLLPSCVSSYTIMNKIMSMLDLGNDTKHLVPVLVKIHPNGCLPSFSDSISYAFLVSTASPRDFAILVGCVGVAICVIRLCIDVVVVCFIK